MRVIHVIPSAFDYFNDIRSQAFKLLNELHKLGIETEAFTLQYGSPNKSEKRAVKEDSPLVHNFSGNFDIDSAMENLSDFDIVHLHCPFFGAAGKILNWKKNNPDIPFVVSFYRDVSVKDFISLFIRFYNNYYMPKIFKSADVITCQDFLSFSQSLGNRYLGKDKKLEVMDEIEIPKELKDEDELENPLHSLAVKMLLVYNTFYK